ncbi:MAG: esterase/lipase family protein [Chitinophagales bacterium]
MPKQNVLFLHGWSGDNTNYGKLPELLLGEGYNVVEQHLGKYISGDDQLSIDDFSIAMEHSINDPDNKIAQPFDIIVHSTGALIVRKWLADFYRNAETCPVKNFIMAAPANNGSLLAGYGKKLPWDWGNKLLFALGLGSHFTWNLNWKWLDHQLDRSIPGLKIFHLQGVRNDIDFPGFLEALDGYFHVNIPGFEESGSDNTVRFSAANLNMKGARLKLNDTINSDDIKQIDTIPVMIFPERSHFGERHGILAAIKDKNDDVYKSILTILNGKSPTSALDSVYPPYSMLNIRVTDQIGNPVEDFITRFYFGSEVEQGQIKIVHRYENKEIDCFYLRINDLSKITKFGFRIEPNRINNTVYSKSNAIDLIDTITGLNFLEKGKTHFVEVMVEKSITKNAFGFDRPGKI